MSNVSGGADWWQASDGRWYPPELHPAARAVIDTRVGPPDNRSDGIGPTEGLLWRRPVVLIVAAAMVVVVIVGLVVLGSGSSTSDPQGVPTAVDKASSSDHAPLPQGTQAIALTWNSTRSGTTFHGHVGNEPLTGTSVQPRPYAETFNVTGTLAEQRFTLTLSATSATASRVSFHFGGTIGAESISGQAHLAANFSTRTGHISFSGTVGGTPVSGTIPLDATTMKDVSGTMTIG